DHRRARLDPGIVPRRGVHRAGADPPDERSPVPGPAFAGRPAETAGADGVRWSHHLLPDRGAARARAALADRQGETAPVALPPLRARRRPKGPTGAALVNPYSTGITYQLIPKAAVDKVPVFSMGYGMTASADGRWFPWVFNFPTTYWSQASAVIRYMAQQEGGTEKLRGKKI